MLGSDVDGMSNWIERVHNVHNRSNVPQVKRRKLEDRENSQDGAVAPVRGGGGILGEYVKDKRKEGNGSASSQALTVDLTDGMAKILNPPPRIGH